MDWSKEKPTLDGLYWFRTEGNKHAKLIEIKDKTIKAGMWILEMEDMHKGEFLGPWET